MPDPCTAATAATLLGIGPRYLCELAKQCGLTPEEIEPVGRVKTRWRFTPEMMKQIRAHMRTPQKGRRMSAEVIAEIRRMEVEKVSAGAIARALGIDRRTVKRYLKDGAIKRSRK